MGAEGVQASQSVLASLQPTADIQVQVNCGRADGFCVLELSFQVMGAFPPQPPIAETIKRISSPGPPGSIGSGDGNGPSLATITR